MLHTITLLLNTYVAHIELVSVCNLHQYTECVGTEIVIIFNRTAPLVSAMERWPHVLPVVSDDDWSPACIGQSDLRYLSLVQSLCVQFSAPLGFQVSYPGSFDYCHYGNVVLKELLRNCTVRKSPEKVIIP